MCPPCAAFNYAKRDQTADLRGRARAEDRGGSADLLRRYELPRRLLLGE